MFTTVLPPLKFGGSFWHHGFSVKIKSLPLPMGTISPSACGPLPEYWPNAVSIRHHGIPISKTSIKNCTKNEPEKHISKLIVPTNSYN